MSFLIMTLYLIGLNQSSANEAHSISKEDAHHLSTLLNQSQKSAEMKKDCDKPKPVLSVQKAQAVIYSCSYDSPKGDAKTGGKQNKTIHVEMGVDNDNTFMGISPKLDTGNDVGYTHGAIIGVKSKSGNQEAGFDFATELYTAPIYTDSLTKTGTFVNQQYNSIGKPTGNTSVSESYLFSGQKVREFKPGGGMSKESIRLVDLSRLTAYVKKGEAFYVKGIIGIETRSRDKALAASIQDWWHGQVLKTYQYDYVNPQAQAERSKTYEISEVTPVNSAAGESNNNAPTKVLTTGQLKDIERDAIAKENLKTNIAPISIIAGGALGTKSQVFQGRCTFEGEAGVLISTENGKIIGPNSNFNFSAKLSGTLAETKKGKPRIEGNVGTMMFFYPEKGVVSKTRSGFTQSLEVSSSHGYKNGVARFTPFVRYSIPIGHQVFEQFNDHDPIMRIGIRYTFGGK